MSLVTTISIAKSFGNLNRNTDDLIKNLSTKKFIVNYLIIFPLMQIATFIVMILAWNLMSKQGSSPYTLVGRWVGFSTIFLSETFNGALMVIIIRKIYILYFYELKAIEKWIDAEKRANIDDFKKIYSENTNVHNIFNIALKKWPIDNKNTYYKYLMFYDYFKKQNEIDKRDIGHEYSLYRVYKENLDTYHHFELAKKRTKIVNYSLMPLFITIAWLPISLLILFLSFSIPGAFSPFMTTFQITVFPLLDFIILYLVPFALICNYQITKYGDFETYTFFYSFDNISPIFGPPFRISPETEVKLWFDKYVNYQLMIMYRANKLIKKSNKIILKYKDYSNLKKLLLEKKHGRIVAYQTLFADRFPGCANWTQKDEFDLCILKDHIKQFTKSDILSAEEYTTKLFCLGFGISNEIYDRETKKLNYQKRFYELDLCDRNKVCDSILENIDVYKKERNENQIELAHIIYNYYMKKFNIVNVNSNCTKRKNKFSNFK